MGPHGNKIRVLLVDDQALVRDAVAGLLQATGDIEIVATAGNVREAALRAREHPLDIVLLDVLSEANAFEDAAALLRTCPGAQILVLDDRASDANVRKALGIGAAGYVTKDQPSGQIANALREVARGNHVFAPEIARRLILTADGARLMTDPSQPLGLLTHREIEVLACLSDGHTVKESARVLGITASTVGNHKTRLMKKLGVHKTVDLARLAIREGLIPKDSLTEPN